jgi:4-diphosphocytidyl-2-C-methyl-D-erythritol kinase
MYTLEPPAKALAVSVSAPAKINLSLAVLGPRDDGFHEIGSLAIGIGLYDSVRCRLLDEPAIILDCNDVSLRGSNNLAHRAAQLLQKTAGHSNGIHIELDKRIPVGGGLGGGSSDAASTLRIGNELWGLGHSEADLAVLGAQIGSDVPLFFHLPAARISGRGECVRPGAMRWTGWAALVFVDCQVSTAAAYRAWRRGDASRRAGEESAELLAASTANELLPLLYNDLEAAVFRISPPVAQAYDWFVRAGIGPWRVSGAGSTLFRLFDDEQEAREMAAWVERQHAGLSTTVVQAPVSMPELNHEEN